MFTARGQIKPFDEEFFHSSISAILSSGGTDDKEPSYEGIRSMQEIFRQECERDMALKKRYMEVKRRVWAADTAKNSPKMKKIERDYRHSCEVRLQKMILRDRQIMESKIKHLDVELER